MRYVAAIQVEITAPDNEPHGESWASDAIGEAMRELCIDTQSGFTEWAYLPTETGWMHPALGNLDHTLA